MASWTHRTLHSERRQRPHRVPQRPFGPNENEKIDEETKRIESTDSETTPFIVVETAEVQGEEHPERSTMNDGVGNEETTNEAGGRHREHLVLRTVNEVFIVFHNDLVEHDKDDGMEENRKSSGIKRK